MHRKLDKKYFLFKIIVSELVDLSCPYEELLLLLFLYLKLTVQ